MFVDRVRVHLSAGNGGAGVVSFERMKGKPHGRPSGGSGGAGGDIILEAGSSITTLLTYKRHPHHHAQDGTHGEGENRQGRHGLDLALPVPLGTVVYDDEGVLIADLVAEGDRAVALRGGRGGRGNAALVAPRRRSPTICEQGEYGRQAWFTLELKLITDAALVGFPNAGKSTFISAVSAAKPKIADYPFTTLQPHLGVVSIDDREFVLCDVPGLIEGAAEGKGLGLQFLRHIERARVLVFILDPSPLQTVPVGEQLQVLENELRQYSPALLRRPRLIVVAKADLPEAASAAAAIEGASLVSAVTGLGLPAVLHRIADLVEAAGREAPEREGFLLHRPVEVAFRVRREGSTWVVEGTAARRAVAFADLTIPEAADMAARRLARLGVDRALAQAGAQVGDEVRIGDLTFEFRATEEP